jgi:MFS family permease
MARNIALNLAYNTLSQLSQSIMQRQILAEYIEVLTGSDSVVGYVSAVSGVAMLLCAFPVGYLTDKFPRSVILKASCVAGLLSSALLILAIVLDDIVVMYATSAAFGVANAMTSAPLMSILADAVEGYGKRTSVFIIQYSLGLLASAVGPLIALVMFWRISAEWDISILRIILHSGNALNILTTILLWWFDDTTPAAVAVEVVPAPPVSTLASLQVGSQRSAFARVRNRGNEESTPLLVPTSMEASSHEAMLNKRNLGHQSCNLGCVRLTVAWIPYIIFASDMIMSLGAGMTVQFFPLFFKNDFSLGPVPVAGIFAVTPVAIAVFAMCAIPVSTRIGASIIETY